MSEMIVQAKAAQIASLQMFSLSTEVKNRALQLIADELAANSADIISENDQDLLESDKAGLAMPLRRRLIFGQKKIADVIEGLESLILLEDPVGKTLLSTKLDEGLSLYRVSCPIGVIGIIFESRPDALVQIASLCLKTGNAVFLKGGSEAARTNRILTDLIEKASIAAGLPAGWITLLESRDEVKQMLAFDEYIDLVIPRGSNEFVRYIMDNTRIPVLGHADGVCHVYVHEDADIEMAKRVVVDSKTQYVAVCNAAETLLIDESVADSLLPGIATALTDKGVELFGCDKAAAMLSIEKVKDWHTEYLDFRMSIRIVSGLEDAIDHINQFGSGHTDAIITANQPAAERFMNAVDSGNVFWNCSTRFSDGFKYGFGAEVGISTSKIHARGPVGLDGLVTYKYKLFGDGQIVDDYAKGNKSFSHEPIC